MAGNSGAVIQGLWQEFQQDEAMGLSAFQGTDRRLPRSKPTLQFPRLKCCTPKIGDSSVRTGPLNELNQGTNFGDGPGACR